MGVQFTELKPGAKRLFESIIYSPNLAYLGVMNEKAGGTIYDRCLVNRLNGTVNGNPVYSKAIADFYGLDLDGTGDYVSLGNVASLDFERTTAFSGLCVLNPNVSAIGSIIGKQIETGTTRGWDWRLSATVVPTIALNNTGAGTNQIVVTSNAALTNGTSYILGFTYTGSSAASGVTLYKNGAADADTDTTNTLSATMVAAGVACIGRRNAVDQDFNGDIGFVALWSGRALTPQEMRLYASLAGFL